MISILNEIKGVKSGKKELKEFGLTIGALLLIMGGFALWRGKDTYAYFLIFGCAFISFGVFLPRILLPLQKIWMGIAVIIGFFMSRVILTILFYFMIMPIGLIMKILGRDILDERINKDSISYWKERSEGVKNKESYENQF